MGVDARTVRLRRDLDGERVQRAAERRRASADDALARRTFAHRCALVAGALPQGAWRVLDDDALGAVFGACELAALLALEATHRGALLAVRGFLQHHRWAHTTMARSEPLAAPPLPAPPLPAPLPAPPAAAAAWT